MDELENETSIAGKVVTVLGVLKLYKYEESADNSWVGMGLILRLFIFT